MNFGVKNNDKTIHFNQVNSIILVIRGVVKMVWQDNYIIINDKKIEFKAKIYKVTSYKMRIFILIGFDMDEQTHCNVYCINECGQVAWQIQPKHKTCKNMENAFISLKIQDGRYSVTNFYGDEYCFNPFNGKLF